MIYELKFDERGNEKREKRGRSKVDSSLVWFGIDESGVVLDTGIIVMRAVIFAVQVAVCILGVVGSSEREKGMSGFSLDSSSLMKRHRVGTWRHGFGFFLFN